MKKRRTNHVADDGLQSRGTAPLSDKPKAAKYGAIVGLQRLISG